MSEDKDNETEEEKVAVATESADPIQSDEAAAVAESPEAGEEKSAKKEEGFFK